jgi:hypothetical protein
MPEEVIQPDSLPPEANEIVRTLATAIRIVKLYPPNNPVYSRTVKEAHDILSRFLNKKPEYYLGVQKTFFTWLQTPVGKETDANKPIAQDLFAKGIRDITFCAGLTEEEMLHLFQTLALSKEDIAMKSGVSSILWGKDVSNIKITEAELDGIITTKTDGGEEGGRRKSRADGTDYKSAMSVGRTLVLDDLLDDPESFSVDMVNLAKRTLREKQTVEDRLIELYLEAARKIQEEHPGESDALFMALAQSIMSLDQSNRQALIAGKLYAGMDLKNVEERKAENEEQLPGKLHEILTARFSYVWEVEQIADLLKKTTTNEIPLITEHPFSPTDLFVMPFSPELDQIAGEISQYTEEEKEALNAMSNTDTESGDTDAFINTLLSLLPLVKNPRHAVPDEMEIARFDSVMRQLEEMLSSLLKKQDYKRVARITNAFNTPIDPAFKPRMLEALRKTSSKNFIASLAADLQNYDKNSSEYISTYSYLSAMEQETTEVLLEMLFSDTGKMTQKARAALLDLLKDIGKNQTEIIGEYLSDDRWFFVSSIIHVLSEIKSDEAVTMLQKAVNNRNVKIRQEVIKGLLSIGGKRAAGILSKFLRDADETVQMAAIRGFTQIKGIKAEDTKPLIKFLEDRSLTKKEQPLTLEAIKALEKAGGTAAEGLLKTYTGFQWWKSWSLQKELKEAAQRAMTEIKRRKG